MPHNQYGINLAQKYVATKLEQSPLQVLAYQSFIRAIGDVDSLRVADFGCGDGYSTRLIASIGNPGSLLGFDLSSEMILRAVERESEFPLGIKYLIGDCFDSTAILPPSNLDLVVGMWVVHYAENKDMLNGFAKNVHNALRPDGRFVTVVQDKFDLSLNRESCRFGERREWVTIPSAAGGKQRIYLLDKEGNELCDFVIHAWSRDDYVSALASNGFREISWTPLAFDEATRNDFDDWEAIERATSCSLLTAIRG